jgi:hypothetical protein
VRRNRQPAPETPTEFTNGRFSNSAVDIVLTTGCRWISMASQLGSSAALGVRRRSANTEQLIAISAPPLGPIILRPCPIDPWPGEPLPDAYDLLIYAKNGHRPQLLEHLAEVFPRHIQIHYGRYQRDELFDAARRSRACAYLADDAHGPLALQEILLAGCPTVGVRTGASFVRTGETVVVVDRLPPGRPCAESDDDVRALAVFMEAIEQAQALDRHVVRDRAAEEFDTDRIVDSVVQLLVAAMREPF